MNQTIASEGLAEAPGNAPASHDDEYDADKVEAQALDAGVKLLAEIGDNDDYRAEREAQQKYRRGEKLDEETVRAGRERWDRIKEAKAESEAIIEARARRESFEQEAQQYGLENVEDAIQYAEIKGQAQALDIQKERADPGLLDRCAETAATYGSFTPTVAKLMMSSPHYTSLVEECLNFPENIAELNSLPLNEVRMRIARAEGVFETRREQQQQPRPAPTVSRAPKPISTVSGRSHAHSLTPDDMSYDQYKAWRQKASRR